MQERDLTISQIKAALTFLPEIITIQMLAAYFETENYDKFKHHLQKARKKGWIEISTAGNRGYEYRNLLSSKR